MGLALGLFLGLGLGLLVLAFALRLIPLKYMNLGTEGLKNKILRRPDLHPKVGRRVLLKRYGDLHPKVKQSAFSPFSSER